MDVSDIFTLITQNTDMPKESMVFVNEEMRIELKQGFVNNS